MRNLVLAMVVWCMAACAGETANLRSAPALPTRQAQINLPDGAWHKMPGTKFGVPGTVALNEESGAIVSFSLIAGDELSPEDAVGQSMELIRENLSHVSDLRLLDFGEDETSDARGLCWSGFRHQPDTIVPLMGCVAARRLGGAPKLMLVAVGSWPVEHDAAMTADFRDIVCSFALE